MSGLSTYRGLNERPGVGVWIKEEDLIVAVLAAETTIEDDLLRGAHRHRVVRDFAGATARGLHELPLAHLVLYVVLHDLVDARQVQSPHRGDGALFKVTTTVHVKANLGERVIGQNRTIKESNLGE